MGSTSCCLNLPPPTSNPSLIPTKKPPLQVSLVKNKEEGCWRRQCVLMGVASYCTLIVGLEMGNPMGHEAIAHEHDMMMPLQAVEVSNNSSSALKLKPKINNGSPKWSEKRACPPWRANSLETIVPENLPRPAARRRYEAVRSTSQDAPHLSSIAANEHGSDGSCFSM